MKRSCITLLLASTVLLSGCSGVSSALEEAEALYAAGNYQNVIWTLEEYRGNEEADALILSANVQMALAEAKKLMSEGEYERAVTVLSPYSDRSEVTATYEEAKKAVEEKNAIQSAESTLNGLLEDRNFGVHGE